MGANEYKGFYFLAYCREFDTWTIAKLGSLHVVSKSFSDLEKCREKW